MNNPQISSKTFFSNRLQKQVDYQIYFPTGYEDSRQAYPVLYRLHNFQEADSVRQELAEKADRAIQSGHVSSMIIAFFPWKTPTLYEHTAESASMLADVLIQEFLPLIDASYRTVASKEGRAIEGVNLWGEEAFKLAIQYNRLFSSVIAYGREADDSFIENQLTSNQSVLQQLVTDHQEEIRGKLRIRLVVQGKGFYQEAFGQLHHMLDGARIPHQYQCRNSSNGGIQTHENDLRFHTEAFLFVKSEDIAKPTDGTVLKSNIPYANVDGHQMLLDLYLPKNMNAPVPVILWIHGGGWLVHSKEYYVPVWMVDHGYAIASINYRLSYQAIFPAQLVDAKAAARWLRAHGEEYNLDIDHMGAWGNSAGGHLAALLGTTGETYEFDRGNNLSFSSQVQAVCDYYGPIDLTNMNHPEVATDHLAPDSLGSQLVGASVSEHPEIAAHANPISYLPGKVPPFLMVHGNKDDLVHYSQSVMIYEALQKAGADASLHIVDGAGHGFEVFGQDCSEVEEIVRAFFDKHLKLKH